MADFKGRFDQQDLADCLMACMSLNKLWVGESGFHFGLKTTVESYSHSDKTLHGGVSHFFAIGSNYAEKKVFLSFKGTQTKQDVLSDIRVLGSLDSASPGSRHAGFAKRADSLQVEYFIDLLNDGWKLFVTGFSLGGAVAALWTLRLLRDAASQRNTWLEEKRLVCICFGAPYVADGKFAEPIQQEPQLRETFHFFVNELDAVVRLLAIFNNTAKPVMELLSRFIKAFGEGGPLEPVVQLGDSALQAFLLSDFAPFGVYHLLRGTSVTTDSSPDLAVLRAVIASNRTLTMEHIQHHVTYLEKMRACFRFTEAKARSVMRVSRPPRVPAGAQAVFNCHRLCSNQLHGRLPVSDAFFVTAVMVDHHALRVVPNTMKMLRDYIEVRLHCEDYFVSQADQKRIVFRLRSHFDADARIDVELRIAPPLMNTAARITEMPVVELLYATLVEEVFKPQDAPAVVVAPSQALGIELLSTLQDVLLRDDDGATNTHRNDIIFARYCAERFLAGQPVASDRFIKYCRNETVLDELRRNLSTAEETKEKLMHLKLDRAIQACEEMHDDALDLVPFVKIEEAKRNCLQSQAAGDQAGLAKSVREMFPLFFMILIRLNRVNLSVRAGMETVVKIKAVVNWFTSWAGARAFNVDLTESLELTYGEQLRAIAGSLSIDVQLDVSRIESQIYSRGFHNMTFDEFSQAFNETFKVKQESMYLAYTPVSPPLAAPKAMIASKFAGSEKRDRLLSYIRAGDEQTKNNVFRFIQASMTIHQLRLRLAKQFTIAVLGQQKAAKTHFVSNAFRVSVSGLIGHTNTVVPTKYPAHPILGPEIYIIDFPGVNDATGLSVGMDFTQIALPAASCAVVFLEFVNCNRLDGLELVKRLEETVNYRYLVCLNKVDEFFHQQVIARRQSVTNGAPAPLVGWDDLDETPQIENVINNETVYEHVAGLVLQKRRQFEQQLQCTLSKGEVWITCCNDQMATNLEGRDRLFADKSINVRALKHVRAWVKEQLDSERGAAAAPAGQQAPGRVLLPKQPAPPTQINMGDLGLPSL